MSLLAEALTLTDQENAALEAARRFNRTQSAKIDNFGHLPAHRTSFVGRDEETVEIVQALAKSRLVTLTGFGGIGKTRAAIEVAIALLGSTWNEVWFVDLAPLTDEAFIAAKIASSIQPPLTHCAETFSTLASALSNRRMLLVLDNCEHLISGAAQAVDVILKECPQIAIIATSREPLNVAGEVVRRLAPLSLPLGAPDRVEDAYSYSAIDLFAQRAEAVDQRFVVDAKTLGAIVNISHRLNGIPLAIELVAAQVPILGLRTIERRLDELFAVSPGRRDLPPRQQTVTATIQWSYELLTIREQAFLCDVCVFSGGFSVEAAEIVCRPELVNEQSILPELSSLVNKSLISLNQTQYGDRYMLPDSVRVFGLDQLRIGGTLTSAFRRHAEWLVNIADHVEDRWADVPAGPIAHMLPEFDNVRAAIAWAVNSAEPDDRSLAGRILMGFFVIWRLAGRTQEHRKWIEAGLERIDEKRYSSIVSQLLLDLILLSWMEPEVFATIGRAVALFDQVSDRRATATLHSSLTHVFAWHGRLEEAERSSTISEALMTEENMRESQFFVTLLLNRATLRMKQRHFDYARIDVETAEALALSLGQRYWAVYCSARLALLEYARGNTRLALEIAQSMMESEFASTFLAGQALEMATNFQLQLGELDQAAANIPRLFEQSARDVLGGHPCLYAATLAALWGDPCTAAKLLGYAQADRPRWEKTTGFSRQATLDLLYASLHEQLDDDAIATAEAEGALWIEETASAEALRAVKLRTISTSRAGKR